MNDIHDPKPARGAAASDSPDPELAAALSSLPREIAPERDLWPELAARLESRRETAPRRAAHQSSRVLGGWPRSLAAAIAWMAVGALATLGVGRLTEPAGPADRGVVSAPAPGLAPARVFDSEFSEPPSIVSPSFAAAEADLLRVKDGLWLALIERRETMSPATLDVIERNLEIIDRAVHDVRRALAADPANPRLEQVLLDNHRRGIALLRRAAQEV
ncbi:MAG: hypothetical protein AAGC60_25900 [Acidobacteriota bacterium]